MATSHGCIELELPLNMLQSCQDMKPGQVVHLAGKAGKQGKAPKKRIKIRTERRDEAVCLQLLTNTLGPAFKKITERWMCLMSDVVPDVIKPVRKVTRATRKQATENVKSTKPNTRMQKASLISIMKEGVNNAKKLKADNILTSVAKDNILSVEKDIVENNFIKQDIKDEANTHDSIKQPVELLTLESPEEKSNNEEDETKSIDGCNDEEDFVSDTMDTTVVNSAPFNEVITICKTENLLEHAEDEKSNLDKESVKCRFCGKAFVTNPARPMMALQQHETKFCKKNPWSRTVLQPKPVKSDKFPFACDYCPQAFRNELQKKHHGTVKCSRNPEHMAKFDMAALMICDICNHMCANELGLAYHRSKAHGCVSSKKPRKPRKSKPCPCRYCGVMQNSHSTRFVHENFRCTSNPNMRPGVRCQYCSQMCTHEKLESHLKKHHTEQERHVCEVCGKVYPGKHKLYQHRLKHREIHTPKHKCPHCDKIYLLKARLQIHMAKHSDTRDIQCAICGKCFKNKHQENKHRVLIHENRYRYRCDKCGHGMAKKVYLENHKCGRVRRRQNKKTEEVEEKVPEMNHVNVATVNHSNDLDDEKISFPINEVCSVPVPQIMPVTQSVPMNVAPGYEFYSTAQVTPYLVQHVQHRYPQQEQPLPQESISLQYFTT